MIKLDHDLTPCLKLIPMLNIKSERREKIRCFFSLYLEKLSFKIIVSKKKHHRDYIKCKIITSPYKKKTTMEKFITNMLHKGSSHNMYKLYKIYLYYYFNFNLPAYHSFIGTLLKHSSALLVTLIDLGRDGRSEPR